MIALEIGSVAATQFTDTSVPDVGLRCAAVSTMLWQSAAVKNWRKEKECSIISTKSPEKELLICICSSDDTGMFGEVCDKILRLKFVDLVLMYWEGDVLDAI